MSRKRRYRSNPPAAVPAAAPAPMQAFTFGDPLPVLSQREVFDYLEAMHNGKWYEPPLSLSGLARVYRGAVHHAAAIQLKRNILRSGFIPHPKLSLADFTGLALDYLVFGNGYLRRVNNRLGQAMRYERMHAKYTRRGYDDLSRYWWIAEPAREVELARGEVLHVYEDDINQGVYGIPDYVAVLNSALLNESATLFRRKYYENGSHAGFILYMTDSLHNESDISNLRQAMRDSKGPGNFRNLFMYAPNGKKDGLQLIPVSEVAAKDDFFNIKSATRDDQLAAHRVPPTLLGVVPQNAGGFGDAIKAAQVLDANELDSLRRSLESLNQLAGEEIIRFDPYKLALEAMAS
ncbi:phage portal protein [Aeromonas veronii]